jgi:hypothetical protein
MGSGSSSGNSERATGQGRHRRGETALALPPQQTDGQRLTATTIADWRALGASVVRRAARHGKPEIGPPLTGPTARPTRNHTAAPAPEARRPPDGSGTTTAEPPAASATDNPAPADSTADAERAEPTAPADPGQTTADESLADPERARPTELGQATAGETLADPGRARPAASADPRRPAAGRSSAGPAAGVARRSVSAEPAATAGLVGLRMFNLGTIPASVTPPRSWRRAAWFTVVASVASLAGLLAIAVVLVGPAQPIRHADARPYFPDGSPLATLGGPATPGRQQRHAIAGTRTDETADAKETRPLLRTTATQLRSTPAAPVGPSSATGSTSTTTRPPIVTTVSTGAPIVDPSRLANRTKSFLSAVTSNVKAAAALTIGTIQDDAAAVIQRKYGDVSSIQIQSVSLDPTSGLTIDVLCLLNKDGSAETQHITLQLTLSGDLKITNPGG